MQNAKDISVFDSTLQEDRRGNKDYLNVKLILEKKYFFITNVNNYRILFFLKSITSQFIYFFSVCNYERSYAMDILC